MATSGDIDPSTMNTLPEVWESATGTWRKLPTAQLLQPEYPRMFLSPNGKVAYVAGGDGISRYLDTSGTGSWSTFATENVKNRDLWQWCAVRRGQDSSCRRSHPSNR